MLAQSFRMRFGALRIAPDTALLALLTGAGTNAVRVRADRMATLGVG